MKILNRNFRHKDRTTDVLSFAMLEGESPIRPSSLGDLVISLPTARKQSVEYQVSLGEELLRLFIHGILHLVGYDHENVSKKEERAMQDMEDFLFEKLHKEAAHFTF